MKIRLPMRHQIGFPRFFPRFFNRTGNRSWERQFYLADVESVHNPLVVVPDIGGRSGREFFVVKQRAEWVEEFKAWLEDPHADDDIGDDEPEPSHVPVHLR